MDWVALLLRMCSSWTAWRFRSSCPTVLSLAGAGPNGCSILAVGATEPSLTGLWLLSTPPDQAPTGHQQGFRRQMPARGHQTGRQLPEGPHRRELRRQECWVLLHRGTQRRSRSLRIEHVCYGSCHECSGQYAATPANMTTAAASISASLHPPSNAILAVSNWNSSKDSPWSRMPQTPSPRLLASL